MAGPAIINSRKTIFKAEIESGAKEDNNEKMLW
jgi:hypothetical protein